MTGMDAALAASRWRRIDAELLSGPLGDPDAFRRGDCVVTERSLADDLRRRAAFSEEELARYRLSREDLRAGNAWPEGPRPVWCWLQHHAKRLLTSSGTYVRLRPDRSDPGGEILSWRWLSLRIPPTILIAAASPPASVPPGRVRILDRSIAPSGPVALLHVHLGPLMPFEFRWMSLRSRLARRGSLADDSGRRCIRLRPPPPLIRGNPPKREPGLFWERALHLAFVARELLYSHAGASIPLEQGSFWDPRVAWLASGRVADGPTTLPALPRPLARRIALESRRKRREIERMVLPDSTLSEAAGPWSAAAALGAADEETCFLRSCFDHLLSADGSALHGSVLYGKLLIQYLRVKTALYRHLVIDAAPNGLASFEEVAGRDKPYEEVAADSEYDFLARLRAAQHDPPLAIAGAEIRVPPKRIADLMSRRRRRFRTMLSDQPTHLVVSLERARQVDQRLYESGVVVRRRRVSLTATWCQGETTWRKIDRLMRARPAVLRIVRGIDLMGQERLGPLWLAADQIRKLREASRQVASGGGGRLEPLNVTLHAGEDFTHLLTGLRAVHEPFAWELMERGDRLGHARALGEDPSSWAQKHAWVEVTAWDRLLDMGWAYHCWDRHPELRSGLDVNHLRASAEDCLRHIGPRELFSGRDPLQFARCLWIALGDRQTLRRVGLPVLRSDPPMSPVLRLIHSVLKWPSVYERAMQPVALATAADLTLLLRLRALVRWEVSRYQTVIEICPSSNNVVGRKEAFVDQPIFRLRPVEPDAPDALPIAINSDDPLVFATCLSDEFAYAWAGMVVEGGVRPSYARQWLEDAAATSMRARFATS